VVWADRPADGDGKFRLLLGWLLGLDADPAELARVVSREMV
jgi:hypothetical protein